MLALACLVIVLGAGVMLEIQQDLVVGTRSHKRMVIGPGGATLRRIEAAAQEDLADHFGVPVRLRLWVRERQG